MLEWDSVLKELADDPTDYDRQGGTALFSRQGKEYLLNLKEVPGVGLSVEASAAGKEREFIPITTFVQRDLLELPILAKQIVRSIEKSFAKRPGKYVEGPAALAENANSTNWTQARHDLQQYMWESDPGTTRLLQLMAPAGQGKTVLLEQVALESARCYQPDPFPLPILLPVDLLGRYVGTVDDAIAGSLNNTYIFPKLTQRDVVMCIRRRWMILALDGFDELVARVGVRDAFFRIGELLEQLEGSGTVLLSARESFFELYRIGAAIRSYLQPRRGGYVTSRITLLPWSRKQGVEVFLGLGSLHAEEDLDGLMAAFDGDADIVYHPFFLTRLADLWVKGERFAGAGLTPDPLYRTRYVIETFIHRESGEKWIDRDGNLLLPLEGHTTLLSGIAEEMWRSGAFRLTAEELRIAAEMNLSGTGLTRPQMDQVLEKVPTHAALITRERGYGFLHDRFLHYFLGHGVSRLLRARDRTAVEQILAKRELGPSVVEWVNWNCRQNGEEISGLVQFLNEMSHVSSDAMLRDNLAHITARVITGGDSGLNPITVVGHTFQGDVLSKGDYKYVIFVDCELWHLDLSQASFQACRFEKCRFGDVRVSRGTRFAGSRFIDCEIASIETQDEGSVFSPAEIDETLRRLGALIERPQGGEGKVAVRPRVGGNVGSCVERFVRLSERTCDVAAEDMQETYGEVVRVVVRVGVTSGVFREVVKGVSGPKKTFYRFRVDRSKLLRGQVELTGEEVIDVFWSELGKRYPPKA
jgi:hypothetical protein